MNKTSIALAAIVVLSAASSEAKRPKPDRPARPETVSCGLVFAGNPTPQAPAQGLVQNESVLLQGAANGVSYVFSVRGKTAVAKMTVEETGQVVTAQGAIEMLRHGGEVRDPAPAAAPAALESRRKGEDDDQDGKPEREAGFDLVIGAKDNPQNSVRLKCQSTNERI